jgi:hypothetical protein
MDTGLIKFVESYLEKDELYEKRYSIYFKRVLSEKARNQKMFYFPREAMFNNGEYCITLDQEDLDYLMDKYYLKYKEEVIKRDEELKVKKEKEIKELEDKLNRLRNEK